MRFTVKDIIQTAVLVVAHFNIRGFFKALILYIHHKQVSVLRNSGAGEGGRLHGRRGKLKN